MKKLISELKRGDVIYGVANLQVQKYIYLCKHLDDFWHVLLDKSRNAVQLSEKDIYELIDQCVNSRDEARALLAKMYRDKADKIDEKKPTESIKDEFDDELDDEKIRRIIDEVSRG